MQLHPYISFEGRCEEAIDFYKQALGAQVVSLMRSSDAPPNACAAAAQGDKIMHAHLKIGDQEVMMTDGMSTGQAEFKGITLSLSVDSDERARELFSALTADGGQVRVEMGKTFFASSFGQGIDKFGVSWIVLAAIPATAQV